MRMTGLHRNPDPSLSMLPRIIGEHPLAKDADGKLKSRIATVFPYGNTIVTLPGIHATQRMAYVDMLHASGWSRAWRRSAARKRPPSGGTRSI